MDSKLDEKLCKQYSILYKQRKLPMTETCMCWGFACGDGWFDIIDKLSAKIEKRNKKLKDKTRCVTAAQVKEKFGQLCFYTDGCTTKEIDEAIIKAEDQSIETCEHCGSKEQVKSTKGWIRYLCIRCRLAKKIKEEL